MEGSTLYRASIAIGHMLRRPGHARRWLDDNVFRKQTAIDRGLPWMAWSAIEYLNANIRPGMRVFEWGGGGSTVFFADRGCEVTTVESSAAWQGAIEEKVKSSARSGSVRIRLIEAETRSPAAIRDYIRSVHDGAPWDIIVVDGLEENYISRTSCIDEARRCLAPGGMIVLDDSYRSNYKNVPQALQGLKRLVFRGLGSARKGVTQTDIYCDDSVQ